MIYNAHFVGFSITDGNWRAYLHCQTPSDAIGYNNLMDSIVSYISREQRSFTELPFNPVDSLVFCALCYLNFERCSDCSLFDLGDTLDTHTQQGVLLGDILALVPFHELSKSSWLEDSDQTEHFLIALRASRRYREVTVSLYANEYSKAIDKQFSACTFRFEDACGQVAYIAFRGTDGSFTGWKEDFNLAYQPVISSQRTALAYVSGVASAFGDRLIFGGHSKGGNLAEYAALCCDEIVFNRIEYVFDHDGPSFLTDPSPRRDSEAYACKLRKLVPESSAFGMILERRKDYRVVQSSAFAVFQHNPYSWLVEDDDFVYQDEINSSAHFFDEALDTWLRSKTPDERERFIQTIYDLFVEIDAESWSEFQENIATNIASMIGASSKLDPETKRFVKSTIAGLGSTLRDQTVDRLRALAPRNFRSMIRRGNENAADPSHENGR